MIATHGLSTTSAHYARMGEQECAKIHAATLEILERTGVDVHDEKALQILVAGGAQADGLRVRIPAYMVARALATAPKCMTLYDRNGKVALRAGGYNTYYGGGSDCLNILDHRTGQRRRPVLKDVVEAATVMDALPEIDFVMSLFLPGGRRPAHLRPLPDAGDAQHHDQADRVRLARFRGLCGGGRDVRGRGRRRRSLPAAALRHLLHQRHLRPDRQRRSAAEVHVPGREGAAPALHPAQRGRRQLAGHHRRLHGLDERRHPAGHRPVAARPPRRADRGARLERRPVQPQDHGRQLRPGRRAGRADLDGQVLRPAGLRPGRLDRFEGARSSDAAWRRRSA